MRRIGLILTVLVLTPVICVGALFFIPGPSGKALLDMETLKESLLGEDSMIQRVKDLGQSAGQQADAIKEKARNSMRSDEPKRFDAPIEAPEETLFKWRGEDGKWHYSNQLPPGKEDFEIVE